MSHLGTRLTALVDGQLPPATAEHLLAHVAVCPPCAGELRAARVARQALSGAGEVRADPALTARLLALGRPAPDGPARDGGAPAARPRPRPVPSGVPGEGSVPLPGAGRTRGLPTGCLHGDLGRRRLPTRVTAGAAMSAAVLGVVLFHLGDLPPVIPEVHPAQALTVLSHARTQPVAAHAEVRRLSAPTVTATTTALSWTSAPTASPRAGDDADGGPGEPPAGAPDPAAPGGQDAVVAWLSGEGWPVPDALPPGYRIAALLEVPGPTPALELDLAGPSGAIVVTLQRGRLAATPPGDGEPVAAREHEVHVLSRAPWHAVWQCDDTVIDVTGQAPASDLTALVAAYPVGQPDEGLTGRMSRGWAVLAGAWDP